jgi:uncharacterized membrane protein (DUF2068 family)
MKNFLPYYILFAGAWAFINGILHDIFVIRKYPVFDKELIRLLIDGHILIFGGVFFFFSYTGIKNQQSWAFYVAIISCIFLLGYCGLILKILPSIVTILVNLVALILLVIYFPKPNP